MYTTTTGGLGYTRRRGLGITGPGQTLDLSGPAAAPTAGIPGYEGSDPTNVIANIGEAVWNVWQNIAYIMGVSNPADLSDSGRAGRIAVEGKFASLVNLADIVNGNSSSVNAAANTAIRSFIGMYGGVPRTATGVAPGDLMGSCLAYAIGPSSQYASQVHQSFSWSPQTRCAQLAALMTGSGLNFVQIALGGDGLGNMPSSSAPTPTPYIGPSYQNLAPSPYAAGGPAALALQNPQVQISTDPVPMAAPVVQVYQPTPAPTQASYQPSSVQQAVAPSPASSPLAMIPAAGSQPAQTSGGRRRNYPSSYPTTAPMTAPASAGLVPSASTASTPATSSSSALGGITDWISANPLIAAGIAAAALYMFSQGGKR